MMFSPLFNRRRSDRRKVDRLNLEVGKWATALAPWIAAALFIVAFLPWSW